MADNIKRVKIHLGGGIRERVIEYAKEEELRLPRAYGELIEKGLKSEEDAKASDEELERYDREVGAGAKSSLG